MLTQGAGLVHVLECLLRCCRKMIALYTYEHTSESLPKIFAQVHSADLLQQSTVEREVIKASSWVVEGARSADVFQKQAFVIWP